MVQEKSGYQGWPNRYIFFLFFTAAIVIFFVAYYLIKNSREDSLKLLEIQGATFTEALAKASENALKSESYYEYLTYRRYHELIVELSMSGVLSNRQNLIRFASDHNLYSIHIFQNDSNLVSEGIADGIRTTLPDYIIEEIYALLELKEQNYNLILDQQYTPGGVYHYYLELTNDLQYVIVIASDALYYLDALNETKIDFLAQEMAKEKGVEYIIYQTSEGIVFSSKKVDDFQDLNSDEFLVNVLESDSVVSRIYRFHQKSVLELVRPFSTKEFPIGVFRVGISLENYYTVSRGYDFQIITIAIVLFFLLVVVSLYLSGRVKRHEISRQFREIKSVTNKIFDEMRTGVAVVNYDNVITLCNNAFETILYADNCIGKKWEEIIPADDSVLKQIIFQKKDINDAETTNKFGNTTKTLLISLSTIHPDRDLPGGMVIVLYDITRLKQFEKKANRKERLSELGNLAAGVAHEIRNPLNTISIAIQRLAGEFQPQENVEEYINFTQQIKTETKRLNEIITRFLALTREQGNQTEKINLTALLNDFISLITPEINELNIQFFSEIESGLSSAGSDNEIKQVLTNIYNNAKEAISTQFVKKIKLSAYNKNGKVVIALEDNGPGIDDKNYDKIFTPYFTTKEAGTGLGLPTVYKIISEMGGEIQIEKSTLGGAKFIITI